MSLSNFDPQGIVGGITSYRKHVGNVLVPAHATKPRIGVPVKAKELATKYLSANRPMVVIGEIWEEGLAIEVGVVIKLREPNQLAEYTNLMFQEDTYRTALKLNQEGDGGIAIT